jgi:hypothetical protein
MNGQPLPKPYMHPEARLAAEIVAQMDGQVIEPITAAEFQDQCDRDVGADPNLPLVAVQADKETGFVTITMDGKTAGVVIFAVRALAAEREAHAREVSAVAERMPPGSYGRKNREEIVTRSRRIIRRARVVEVAYDEVIDKRYLGI